MTSSSSLAASRYLQFLGENDLQEGSEQHFIASRSWKKCHVLEVKGDFDRDWLLRLPLKNFFWLQFQFIGQSERTIGPYSALSSGEYQGFFLHKQDSPIRIKAGRTWLVLLGIKLDKAGQFAQEWPQLAAGDRAQWHQLARMDIGYRIKQVFEKIEQVLDTPYSLRTKMVFYTAQLCDIYQQDLLDKLRSQHKEDIYIYQEAINYISEHYMDAEINSEHIAKQLGISERKLYRIFEGKHISIHSAIQTIRLYKAREMLRETKQSIDLIAADLNFSTRHYFYRQYVLRFGHSPSKERELHRRKKKKKRPV